MAVLKPRLCVFHPGSLGDCLLSVPAIRILRETFPSHFLVWYGNHGVGDLLMVSRIIDERHSFDQRNVLNINPWRSLNGEEVCDSSPILDQRAVFWGNDGDGWWRNWCDGQGVSSVICRSPFESSLSSLHVSDRYIQTLSPWKGEDVAVTSDSLLLEEPLSISFPPRTSLVPLEKPIIAIHPGSGSIHKCASPEFFINLVDELITHELGDVVLLGGPADDEVFRHLTPIAHDRVLRVQELDLLAMSRVLQQVQVYVGHDSGLSHLSACLGIPSIVLFGPTNPEYWAPRGPHIQIVRNPCSCHSWDLVRECSTKSCLKFSPSAIRDIVRDFLVAKGEQLSSQDETLVTR